MNLPRLFSYGRRISDTFYPSFYSAFTKIKSVETQPKFFSTVIDSHFSLNSNKLTLMPFTPLILNSRGMKVKEVLELRCKNCYFERKDGVMYVKCSSYKRHNQMEKPKSKKKYNWILTFASQSKFRPY